MVFRYQAPFDPSREFVALTNFRGAGTVWGKGADIRKERFSDRTLRLLFDHHKIGFKDDEQRQDIRTLHISRRHRRPEAPPPARDIIEKAPEPEPRERGPATRPIQNPNRRRRARAATEGGADAGQATAAGEAAESAPPEPAPAGDNQEANTEANLNAREAAPPPAAHPLDHDEEGHKGGSKSGDESTSHIGAERREEAASADDRVAELIRHNTHDQLATKADKLPGFRKAMSKTQLAKLIVGAESPGDGTA